MIIKKSLTYILARGVPGLINLLTISVFTRLIDPDIYGQYMFSIAFITLMMTVCHQWLQFGLLRFYHIKDIENSKLLSTILFAFILISLTLLPVFIIIIHFIQVNFSITTLLYIYFLSIILSFFNLHLQIPIAKSHALEYGILSSTRSIFALLLGLLFIYLGYKLNGLLSALIFAYLLPTFWKFSHYWNNISWRFIDIKLLKSLFMYGLPISGTLMMNSIIGNSDRIMLSWLKSNELTGLYSAVYDLTNFSLTVLMMAINMAIYPLIIKAYENKQTGKVQTLLKQTLLILHIISLPFLVLFLLLPNQLSDLFLGLQFRQVGRDIMPIIALSTFFWGIKAFYFDIPFLLTHKTLSLFIIAIIGMLLNIILNYSLIPDFGIHGAAYATLITTISVLVITSIWSRLTLRLPNTILEILKILILTIIVGILLQLGNHAFHTNIIINSLTVFILYIMGSYFLNILNFRPYIHQFLKKQKQL